jgi:hypothetical protein
MEFAFDLEKVIYQNMHNWKDDTVFPLSEYGLFFPEFIKEPLKYVQP